MKGIVVTLYPLSALMENSTSQNAFKVNSLVQRMATNDLKARNDLKHVQYKILTCSNLYLFFVLEPSVTTYNLHSGSLPSEIKQC